jgi:Zn-dependent protease with chaperone function
MKKPAEPPDLQEILAAQSAARDQYVAQVKVQEEFARRDPAGYRRRVARFAALGYAYLITVVAVLLAILGGIAAFSIVKGRVFSGEAQIVFVIGAILLAVLRSLWIKIEPPEGVSVSRETAPRLWAAADGLAARFHAPQADVIIIEESMNAMAAVVPRFGLFGPAQQYLVIGLPLLHALSKTEMESVLAHEFGHFGGRDGKFGGTVYRLNESFDRIRQQVRSGNWLFSHFFNWFQPKFDALSFAMRRQNEYDADRCAATATSPEIAAQALMRLSYLDRHFAKTIREPVRDAVIADAKPPTKVLADIGQWNPLPKTSEIALRLQRRLAQTTDYDDSHPCLSDRLSSLNQPVADVALTAERLSKPMSESAAAYYLGPHAASIAQTLDAVFLAQTTEYWLDLVTRAKEGHQKLAGYEARATPLTLQEQLEYADLVETLRTAEDSLPIYRKIYEEHPTEAHVVAAYGSALATAGQAEGIELLREAMRRSPALPSVAIEAISEFAENFGEPFDRDEVTAEAQESQLKHHLLEQALDDVSPDDEFAPSSLPTERRAELAALLKNRSEVTSAYLVDRVFHWPIEYVSHLIVVVPNTKWAYSHETAVTKTHTVVWEILPKDDEFTLFCPVKAKPFQKRLDKIEGAKLF